MLHAHLAETRSSRNSAEFVHYPLPVTLSSIRTNFLVAVTPGAAAVHSAQVSVSEASGCQAEAGLVLQIFVPAGNSYGPDLFDVEKLRGGSAWGAGTFAGPTGARQPTTLELDIAQHQVGCSYEPFCLNPNPAAVHSASARLFRYLGLVKVQPAAS